MKTEPEVREIIAGYEAKIEWWKALKGYDWRTDVAFLQARIQELKWVLGEAE